MNNNLLVISPFVPYDKVDHAGGQIHNYYLKRLQESNKYKIKLVTFAFQKELNKIDLKKYRIDNKVIVKKNGFRKLIRGIINIESKYNIFNNQGGQLNNYFKLLVRKTIRNLKKNGYEPSVIILVWTESILLINTIKKYYPKSKYLIFEHDVTFQKMKREYLVENNSLRQKIKFIRYNKEKKSEISAIREANIILVLNSKDKNLLIANGINQESIRIIAPYFHKHNFKQPVTKKKNLLFYGAMNRKENYESCIWFIENVFKKLLLIDPEFKLFVVGGAPVEKLLKYKSYNIIITGFVEDLTNYFQQSMCLVAPLLMGAGIKIKVLEAMSAGIPVLTNNIGIEGIPAKSNYSYLHCETSDQYINKIIDISSREIDPNIIVKNAREMLTKNFNPNISYEGYSNMISQFMKTKW